MVEAERRKGGGKLARSETVTVRLDPKLRYLADLAARRQRRTLSSYVEWAIEDSLKHVSLDLSGDVKLADEAEALWDVDEADRFVKLALRHPDLLAHEEQVLWKLIRENGWLWRGSFQGARRVWSWTIDEDSMAWDRLREHWPVFNRVAEGNDPASVLPTWTKNESPPVVAPKPAAKSTGFDDMDDDIPF